MGNQGRQYDQVMAELETRLLIRGEQVAGD
jgi:hypothetical protein